MNSYKRSVSEVRLSFLSPVFAFGDLQYSTPDTQDTGSGPFLDFPLPDGVIISISTSFEVNLDLAAVNKGSVWLDILDENEESGMRFRLIVDSPTQCRVRFRKKTPDQDSWQEMIDNQFDAAVLKVGVNKITIATTGTEYITVVNGVELHLENTVPVDSAVLVQVSKIQIRLSKNDDSIEYGESSVLAPGPGMLLVLPIGVFRGCFSSLLSLHYNSIIETFAE